jgi:hypothetical protein
MLDFSRSSASQTEQIATDTGRIVRGNQYTEGGALSIGSRGKYLESKSMDLSGSKGANIGGMTVSSGAGNISVEQSDPEVVKAALAQMGDVTKQFSGTLTELVEKQNAAVANAQTGVFDQLAALAESKQTSGESAINKSVLYVALAVVAALLLLIWRR